MKSESLAKLAEIFLVKYYEVLGVPNPHPDVCNLISRGLLKGKSPPRYSTWMKYLEGVDCRVVPKSSKKGSEFVYVDDPCYGENKIEIKIETAERVLVLGLP